MDISAGLVAKALAGASAVAASVGVATNWDEISDFLGNTLISSNESKILKEAGLKCVENAGCTLEADKKIKIKHGVTTSGEISTLPTSRGKIKLHKDASYEGGLKFVIEGGDIAISDGSITKLERDETYELKKETEGKDSWILERKTTTIEEINKKLDGLGLPSGCKLDDGSNPKSCDTLGDGKLNSINFDGKSSSSTNNIDNAENVTLKLEKTDDREIFPNGVKIIFEVTNSDVNIPKEGSGNITLKKGTNPEFKIVNGKLKRAWDKNTIEKKIGLKCEDNGGKCTLDEKKKINIMNSSESKKTGITSQFLSANWNIKLYKNIQNYYQGFKFKVEDAKITLTGGTKEGNGTEITELAKDSEYEMKFEENKWYLSKKSN